MDVHDKWVREFFDALSDDGVLRRRESNTIEFKESFNWSDKGFRSTVARTAAAYANRDGGMIIFGVANKPHKLVGVKGFDDVDDAEISSYFNEHFSPSIAFERFVCDVKERPVGVIHVIESKSKPVICIKDSPRTFDSDIYYRYSARSSKIKSGDLSVLIKEAKNAEQEKWMRLIQNIAKSGVENIAILNSSTGEIQTSNNSRFLLDESILSSIKFLDEYSESAEGAPAVKIVGEVEGSATIVEKTKNIFEEDIFRVFLSEEEITLGEDYVAAILRMNSEIYPIYYFLNKDGVPPSERVLYVESIQTRFKNKEKVVSRLQGDAKIESKKGQYSISSPGQGEKRKDFYEALVGCQDLLVESEYDCKLALESIFSLDAHEVDVSHVKHQVLGIYDRFYPFEKDGINYVFRWALSYLDNIVYK